ncbi:ATP-binding protein [Nocardia sp. NPDC057663]|uniref:ATP-binding protein n=1 Tax=Nocardia sp. NPDC057663 TaxID=3346201 RepID=UPI00366C9715
MRPTGIDAGAVLPLRVVIGSRIEQIERAHARLTPILHGLWGDDSAVWPIELAVHEAVINAIEHSGGDGNPDATVEITLDIEDDELLIEISDQGPGFDPDIVPDPRLPEGVLRASGRGVLLMRTAVDSLEAAHGPQGRFTLTLRTKLPRSVAEGVPPHRGGFHGDQRA